MILVDYSQVSFGQVMNDLAKDKSMTVDEHLLRHLILNQLRSYAKKFGSKYGQMVLCFDESNSWRRSVFEHYKSGRRKSRENSDIDWEELFSIMGKIRDEVREFLPYVGVGVRGAEGDDVIAVLAKTYRTEKHLIVSSDKDFQQLQVYDHIEQYSPILKKMIKCARPTLFLAEHVIRGDSSDGIPNVLTPEDFFVREDLKRQKSVMVKNLSFWLQTLNEEGMPLDWESEPELARRWKLNNRLINLIDQIPDDVEESILGEFQKRLEENRDDCLYSYLVEKRCKYLLSCAGDFYIRSRDYPDTHRSGDLSDFFD